MDTLAYIAEKFSLDFTKRSPIEIRNTNRVTLAKLFYELNFKTGTEVGTEGGVYAEIICSNNPGVNLTCVDAWAVYPGYRDHINQERLSHHYGEAKNRLSKYSVTMLQKYSMDAVKDFTDGSLDFVYIDANHEWPYVTQDIYYWSSKVRPGGIVSGHDYYISTKRDSKCHVKGAVNGYTYSFRINPWFILGINERIPGELRDTSRSWFWVKDERLH